MAKADRLEVQRMKDFEKKYLVLQPYFDIITKYYKENCKTQGGGARSAKKRK